MKRFPIVLQRKVIPLAFCLAVVITLCGCRTQTPTEGSGTAQTQSTVGDSGSSTQAQGPAEDGGSSTQSKVSAEDSSSAKTGDEMKTQIQLGTSYEGYDKEPYAVRTLLRDYSAVDPADTKHSAYGRYTELIVEGEAPDTFRDKVAEYNRRAEESAKSRANQFVAGKLSKADIKDGKNSRTFGYITTLTRADEAAFSFLGLEFEKTGAKNTSEIEYHFEGTTCDTKTGEEIALADLLGSAGEGENKYSGILRDALSAKYQIEDLAKTEEQDYAWTADALGVRFYFNSDAVSQEKRREIKDYSSNAVTVSFSYDELQGEKVKSLQAVPDAYIAMIDREKVYELPHGDLRILLTKKDDVTVIRYTQDQKQESELQIEYADEKSDFYMIRSQGDYYLFRGRIGYQEGFFYNFKRPDGGFGRFAYNTAQYFDSFMREICLALPYNPYCVHMAEVKRSFGETSYDIASFVPHGHYAFPSDPKDRYMRFLLKDRCLQIDSYGMACRLLEDLAAVEIDEGGNELDAITVPAGEFLFFEAVSPEAARYDEPPKRSFGRSFLYECRLRDGKRIRFESKTEPTVSVADKGYMNRFSEPVAIAEVQPGARPAAEEAYYVRIGGKEYPLIPDYFKKGHAGEEIDFGEDLWWQAEGYPGRYISTEEDLEEMKDAYFTEAFLSQAEKTTEFVISDDGEAVLKCLGQTFRGKLPEKRYYKQDVELTMESEKERRTFRIVLREGEDHSVPTKIELYSEGLPATNEPSHVPSLSVYLTRVSD